MASTAQQGGMARNTARGRDGRRSRRGVLGWFDSPESHAAAVLASALVVSLAVGVKLGLNPVWRPGPFALLYGAVAACAWYAGARAGIAAALLGTAAGAVSIAGSGGAAGPGSLVLFLGETLFVTAICHHLRDGRERAERRSRSAGREIGELREAARATREITAGLAALNRLGTALAAELEPSEAGMLAAEGAVSLTKANWSAFAFDRFGRAEPVRANVGFSELPFDVTALRASLGGRALWRLADVRDGGGLSWLSSERHPVRSALVARVDGRSGQGILYVGNAAPDAFGESDEQMLGVLAVQTAAALDNAHYHADAQNALAAAHAAARLKDEFVSTLSHELRTPLNAILGWAHLLQGRKLSDDDTQRAVQTIVRNALLQESMIGELLDMSSLLNGRLRLKASRVDLREAVEDAVATARNYARTKGVELRIVTPPSPVLVMGDPTRLQQVAWSLLSNAVKFTPAGGHVQVDIALAEGTACVVVSDTGAGMEPEFLARLFSRFSREDASSTRPTRGLGLGLAVARGLVELHGGQLLAESPGSGQGSTFTIRLPLADADEVAGLRVSGGNAA